MSSFEDFMIDQAVKKSDELTCLRSQVERLTGERSSLEYELNEDRNTIGILKGTIHTLTQERDQATAACAVIVKKTNERERDLRAALLEFVRVENNFGHSGQDKPEDCADCKRVIAANKALSHGYCDPLSNEAITLGNSLLERLKEARELLGKNNALHGEHAMWNTKDEALNRHAWMIRDNDTWLKGTP